MIGDRVTIGTGASVLGSISIGADSVIGAAAVVVRDAPAGSLLVGAPATARPRARAAEVEAVGPDAGLTPDDWFFQI